MKPKKYSNKELDALLTTLVNNGIYYPKNPDYYHKLEEERIKDKGVTDEMIHSSRYASDLVADELWWDVCDIVKDLAELLLEEREKREEFRKNLQEDLKFTLKQLSSKKYLNL